MFLGFHEMRFFPSEEVQAEKLQGSQMSPKWGDISVQNRKRTYEVRVYFCGVGIPRTSQDSSAVQMVCTVFFSRSL